MKRFLCLAMVILALPAAAWAAAPAPTPEGNSGLLSFDPRPTRVLVQKDSDNPELGNIAASLEMSIEEIKRLEQTTGQTAYIAIGDGENQVVFRDDGEFGDREKSDGLYTALATVDLDDLAARAAAEREAEDQGELKIPVFENRAIVGETEAVPFDLNAFDHGEQVVLTQSLSISNATGEISQQEGEVRSTSAAAVVPGTNQFQERVLMIRNAAVVQDPLRTFDVCTGAGTPLGPWTFGHLATQMANTPATGINVSNFVETWLLHWTSNQTINGFNVPARPVIQALINDWRAASGGGDLNMKIAPFRLLAIDPRIDLRTTTGSGGTYTAAGTGNFLDAGEARFTFGVILPDGYVQSQPLMGGPIIPGTNCRVTRFSVIFEFRVPKCKCEHVRDWARAWIRLNSFVPGSATYNGLLEKLTRTFTDANANPIRPNGSAISQVRSNEIALAGPWEIREFQLRMMPWSFLLETTTADTPDDSWNNTNLVGQYMNDVAAGNLSKVPLFYPLASGNNFLGAHPQTPNPFATFWDALPPNPPGRFQVSIGTCNGCHARETNTIFQHIESFQTAPPATLSQFLTGTVPPVLDPSDLVTLREFDDLARRELDINAVARMLCGKIHPIRVSPIRLPPIGPLTSDGNEVQSASAAATAEPDFDAPPVSIGLEDFLREPVTQVH